MIGTPGTIKQVLSDKKYHVKLDGLRLLAFDEADQLFEDGDLKNQIETILRKSRIPSRCQYLGLSATFTEDLKERLIILMNEYIYLNAETGNEDLSKTGLEGVLQYCITLPSRI